MGTIWMALATGWLTGEYWREVQLQGLREDQLEVWREDTGVWSEGQLATRSLASTGDYSREIEDNMSHSTKGTIVVYPTVLMDMNTLTIQGVTATGGLMGTLTSGLMATGHQFPVCP